MERYNYQQWKKISENLTKTKQNTEQLSKFYIVSHERVKAILRRCQTDVNYDPTQDSERQLNNLKDILQQIANRQNDQYLVGIDEKTIYKYQKHFFGLVQLLRLALITQNSKDGLNTKSLIGINEGKNGKGEFGLRAQLKKSEQRMIRTKSGHRITKAKPKKVENQQQYQDLIQQKDPFISNTQSGDHVKKIVEKQKKIQDMMNSHIEKQGLSVNFKNKYLKLDSYLNERKQFADLFFCQQYFDKMISQGKTRKNEPKIQEKKDPDLNKLFPQFNIKTKFMKKQVRQNVLKVIFEVKKELLKEYHLSNVARMAQANEGGMIPIQKTELKKKNTSVKNKSLYSSSSVGNFSYQRQLRFKSTNRPTNENFRNTVKSFKINEGRMTKPIWKQLPSDKKTENKVIDILGQSKFKQYKKSSTISGK